MPPKALNAASDLGLSVLLSWPGENAKGLLAASKSFLFDLSARSASSGDTSSPSNLERNVLTSELVLDRAVSAVELKELALERNVSPPNEFAVGEDGTWRLRREWSPVDLNVEQSDSKDAVDAESC